MLPVALLSQLFVAVVVVEVDNTVVAEVGKPGVVDIPAEVVDNPVGVVDNPVGEVDSSGCMEVVAHSRQKRKRNIS